MATLTAEHPHSLQTLCRRFSNLVGWPVRFAPAGSQRASELEQWLLAPSDYCWATEITDGERRLGYLYIDLPHEAAADRTFLTVCGVTEILAELLSQVASARLSLDAQTRDISALVAISQSPAAQDVNGSLDRLLQGAMQLTGFRAAGFLLLRPDGSTLHLRALQSVEPLQIPFEERTVRENAPDFDALARGNILVHRDLSPRIARWLPEGCATAVCLPVRNGAGALGTLWVFDRRRRIPGDREFHVLESVAAQIAAVLERAVLLQESANHHRLQRHLQLASESRPIDASQLLPPDSGFEISMVCTSRYEIGGDLCEIIPLDRARTLLAVGDASGDSVPAALIMSIARGALRSLALEEAPNRTGAPDRIVRRLNRILHETTLPHQFMSLVCGTLDQAGRTFAYTNAGHPNPLLFRGGTVTQLDSHGMLLGVTGDAAYGESVLKLVPDDILVMFSDGITEAMNSRSRMFRSDGIVDSVLGCADRSAQEIVQAVWSSLQTHTADGEGDDRTLMVLKVRE